MYTDPCFPNSVNSPKGVVMSKSTWGWHSHHVHQEGYENESVNNTSVEQYTIGCLRMVTYKGMGEYAYTVKWCGCGYLRPWAMFDTCMGIFNVITIWHVSGRTHLAIKFRLANKCLSYWCTTWLFRHLQQYSRRNTLSGMVTISCRFTYVSDTIDGVQQIMTVAVLMSGYIDNKSRQVSSCCIVVNFAP